MMNLHMCYHFDSITQQVWGSSSNINSLICINFYLRPLIYDHLIYRMETPTHDSWPIWTAVMQSTPFTFLSFSFLSGIKFGNRIKMSTKVLLCLWSLYPMGSVCVWGCVWLSNDNKPAEAGFSINDAKGYGTHDPFVAVMGMRGGEFNNVHKH